MKLIKKIILFSTFFLIIVHYSNAQTGETELFTELEKTELKLNIVFEKLKSKINDIDK